MLTNIDDPNVSDMFVAGQEASFAEATKDMKSEKRPWKQNFVPFGNMIRGK